MGIRKKISLGFFIIGAILFISSVIALFEFNRIKNSVTELMNANISSINTSRKIMELTDEYNFILLSSTFGDSLLSSRHTLYQDDRFKNYISSIKENFRSDSEVLIADSLEIAYTNYLDVVSKAVFISDFDSLSKSDWYYHEFMPVYNELRRHKKNLGSITQKALLDNTIKLQDGYYRSIMPGIIAVTAGIVLVLLFNYFVNLYFISPVLLISKGIKCYRENRKSYNVKFDNDDEIQEINNEVKSIIDENKKLKAERSLK